MTDKEVFIRGNKEILNTIFREIFEDEKKKVFTLPEGKARNIQIEFVKFLAKWLFEIEIFSKETKTPETGI
jgi:hypothetical protein